MHERRGRSNRPHLTVIDPAMKTPEIDCYNHISSRSGCRTTYHLPALHGLDSLRRFDDSPIDGIVILGSGASVYDNLPWQRPLNDWIQERCLAGVPTIGLCYGHQLLADVFGGTVEILWNGEKAKGTRVVSIDRGALLTQPMNEHLIVSHREGVTKEPPDFYTFGRSLEVRVDAMKHAELPIWGFQPHIEATPDFLTNNAIDAKPEHASAAFKFGQQLMDAFFAQVSRD